ncbi:hypothetical protein CP533_3779 [Ophiocordyceps camponoti-saundersi (nom. inval.)]|nr:hypothetical protein CP533_3779 [Ophiocordyceps camponoti-saundersi (nom. inval.)]
MQPKVNSLYNAVLVILLGVSTADASSTSNRCFAGMKSLFRDNTKQACYGFTKGNMSEVTLEHLCSIDGGKFDADKCDTTRSILSASCGTDIQAITSSCRSEYPELKHPHCVDDPCYLSMVKNLPGSYETRCDAVLDGGEPAFGSYKSRPKIWQSCDRSTAKVKSTCQCVRPRERTMEDDEKQCLQSIGLRFGEHYIDTACYQMLTDKYFLAQHHHSLIHGCGTNEETIQTACQWKNKLLGYSKCLDNSCYRGLAKLYGHEENSNFCGAVIDGKFTQSDLKSEPELAWKCGGKLEELRSACFCLYPAERYPKCSHDECFRGVAGDWGEDLATNCRTLLTRNFTDGSDPECKNELEGLVREAEWLGLHTYAFQACGKDPNKLVDACRCALPDIQRTTFNVTEKVRAAVTTSSSIEVPTPIASQRTPSNFKENARAALTTSSVEKSPTPSTRRKLPFRTQKKSTTTKAASTSSKVRTTSAPALKTTTPASTSSLLSDQDLESTSVRQVKTASPPAALQEDPVPTRTSSSSRLHAWDESTRISDEDDDSADEEFPDPYARPSKAAYVVSLLSKTTDKAVTVAAPDYDIAC